MQNIIRNIATLLNVIAPILLFVMPLNSIAQPLEIRAIYTLPESITKGDVAHAYYYVYNQGRSSLSGLHVEGLPENVKQITTPLFARGDICKAIFDLNRFSDVGCVLQLEISGDVNSNDNDDKHHLKICDKSTCSIINKNDELNIVYGKYNTLTRIAAITNGANTRLLKSIDGGISWDYLMLNTPTHRLNARIEYLTCYGLNHNYCVAVGERIRSNSLADHVIYTTNDGGINWALHDMGLQLQGGTGLTSVSCSSKHGDHCIAVGMSHAIDDKKQTAVAYISENHGSTWSKNIISNDSVNISDVSCSGSYGNICVAVGTYAGIIRNGKSYSQFVAFTSHDGGTSWNSDIIDLVQGTNFIKSINCPINGKACVAVASFNDTKTNIRHAIIYTSKNNGVQWTSYIPTSPDASSINSLEKVTCDPEGKYCEAIGSDHASLRTNNGGKSWEYHRLGLGIAYQSLTCSGEMLGTCTAISIHRSVMYRAFTSDSGNAWSENELENTNSYTPIQTSISN